MCSKRSEQATKNRLKAIALITIVNGIITKDMRLNSLVNNFLGITKYTWKNNKKARTDAIQTVLCKLGF